jgi:hypothetical protein
MTSLISAIFCNILLTYYWGWDFLTKPSALSLATRRHRRLDLAAVQGHGRHLAKRLPAAAVGCPSVSRNPPFGCDGDRHHRSPARPGGRRGRRGRIPEGAFRTRNGDSSARFAPQGQVFLRQLSPSRLSNPAGNSGTAVSGVATLSLVQRWACVGQFSVVEVAELLDAVGWLLAFQVRCTGRGSCPASWVA